MANHVRWCLENPMRFGYERSLQSARSAKVSGSNQYAHGVLMSDETKQKIRAAAVGRTHTNATREVLRQKALASPHRRLKKNMTLYKGQLFDSSWEVALAKRLDSLSVKWVRPGPIPWVDDQSISHHYFPDFFLPAFDVFLDPKNPQAARAQSRKLEVLQRQYRNIIILRSLEECETYTPQFYSL